MTTFLPSGPLVIGGCNYSSLQERVAEAIRCAGMDWHRENDKQWRDKPWHDGIRMDLDEDDECAALARAAITAVQEVLL